MKAVIFPDFPKSFYDTGNTYYNFAPAYIVLFTRDDKNFGGPDINTTR